MAFKWTDEKNEQISQLCLSGKTGGEIADIMGLNSRSSGLAQIARLGLSRKGQPQWTPANEVTFLKMLSEGSCDAVIAKALGKSRLAVAAKRKRLGLTHNPDPNNTRNAGNRKPFTLSKPRAKPAPKAAQIAQDSQPVDIMSLTLTTCRWPVESDPVMYCGATCPETVPYCAHHSSLAYAVSSLSSSRFARSLRRYAS